MSSNEEPMSATEQAGAEYEQPQVIDLDDVEGHGMREVAAGLGAAAILAGGGTAAAAAVGVHQSLPNLKPTSPPISDPIGTVDRATDWAIQHGRDARDAALATAQERATSTAASARQAAADAQQRASSAAADAQQRAAGAAAEAQQRAASARQSGQAAAERGMRIAQSEVDEARGTVMTAEAGAMQTAQTTAAGAQTTAATVSSTAQSAAQAAAEDAARKTATVLRLAVGTANALETTIVATVEDLNPEASGGMSGSSGWVTFSLGGQNVASAQVSNGQATVTIKTPPLGGALLQAVYSGDSVHTSSMRSITL